MEVKKSKKVGIVVKETTASALGMSVETAAIKVGAILQKHKILPANFMSILLENGKPIVCTTSAIIACDQKMSNSQVLRQANVGCIPNRSAARGKFSVCPSGCPR